MKFPVLIIGKIYKLKYFEYLAYKNQERIKNIENRSFIMENLELIEEERVNDLVLKVVDYTGAIARNANALKHEQNGNRKSTLIEAIISLCDAIKEETLKF